MREIARNFTVFKRPRVVGLASAVGHCHDRALARIESRSLRAVLCCGGARRLMAPTSHPSMVRNVRAALASPCLRAPLLVCAFSVRAQVVAIHHLHRAGSFAGAASCKASIIAVGPATIVGASSAGPRLWPLPATGAENVAAELFVPLATRFCQSRAAAERAAAEHAAPLHCLRCGCERGPVDVLRNGVYVCGRTRLSCV